MRKLSMKWALCALLVGGGHVSPVFAADTPAYVTTDEVTYSADDEAEFVLHSDDVHMAAHSKADEVAHRAADKAIREEVVFHYGGCYRRTPVTVGNRNRFRTDLEVRITCTPEILAAYGMERNCAGRVRPISSAGRGHC